MEINAQPHRLDLRPAHARLAIAAGVKLVISTDAHRMAALDYQELGVSMARRAGATKDDIANARPLAEFQELRKPAGPDVSEPDRSSEGLVFVSTGRRLAAAKVGRRWHEVRGPLMIAAALASAQAVVALRRAARAAGRPARTLRWIVPITALTTLALVAWMGLVRAAFGRVVPLGQAPAAAILETIEAVRGALRGGFDAAERAGRRLRGARAPRLRRRRRSPTASTCSRTPASAPTTTARACPRRRAPSTR